MGKRKREREIKLQLISQWQNSVHTSQVSIANKLLDINNPLFTSPTLLLLNLLCAQQ